MHETPHPNAVQTLSIPGPELALTQVDGHWEWRVYYTPDVDQRWVEIRVMPEQMRYWEYIHGVN